ncbi:Bor family protein [Flavobacteriaceae bacterium]|nr:hypothetical protein [Flavobacteriaceae bacterium]MDC3259686.1 Bor family protein [Flavobacteriaceae bacterium]
MKKVLLITLMFAFTSCYTTQIVVGEGAKGNQTIRLKQTHLINGLVSFEIPEMKQIIDKKNYTITTKHSFIDLALNSFTFGIYSPTTLIIKH